jgi:glutamate N-acetyltransferase/amino-acid N-acetyltransferase
MAVGKSGEAADRDRLTISFRRPCGGGKRHARRKYNEATATKAVSGREVVIAVDLGLGKGAARVWTCDLTHGYIDINGSYARN